MELSEMKAEAVKRMKLLMMKPEMIKRFEESGEVYVAEPALGRLSPANGKQKAIIREVERENNIVVYLAMNTNSSFGNLDSYLYVSEYKEEWNRDIRDLKNGTPVSYVHNYDEPMFSEFGYIGIESTPFGFRRTM